MITPILTTKLHIPPSASNLVQRSRLFEILNNGLENRLILVSASAGFGKTTLVASWLDTIAHEVAWLSLEEADSNVTRFLRYFITALQTIEPAIGQTGLPILDATQHPPVETVMTLLLNDITACEHDLLIVLDDYHSIDASEIDTALTFLVDHLPANMTLVIITREDLQLPLAKYRARAMLTELRATDLRFTNAEMHTFLNQMMGLGLTTDAITALENRTEGWIASLQMAAISLERQADKAQFIETFTGSHRYILDYLLEEVLQQQSERIRNFLLRTSILRRLNADLCDAVTQTKGSQSVLLELERRNLFIIPLDNTRQWYRYHHLFADLLRKRLGQFLKEDIITLHILASQWLEKNNQGSEAIYHALTAKDFERAADMIEHVWATSHGTSFQNEEQYGWMQALPQSIYRNRPVLSAAYGWVLLDFGDLDTADERLRNAEYWLDSNSQADVSISEMIVMDQTEFEQLPVTIASARAFHALALGDVPNTIKYGQQVLTLADKNNHHRRGIATSIMGLAHWYMGNLSSAYQHMTAGMAYMMELGNIHFALSSTFGLADVRLGQGRLRDAIAIYKQSLQIAESQPYMVEGLADLYMGLGDLYREQNDLATAQEYLLKSETLGTNAGLPDWRVRFCKLQARMAQTMGSYDEALRWLDEAEQLYYPTPVPNIRPIPALRASVYIRQGELHTASMWANQHGLKFDTEVNYLNEFELITLARLGIAHIKTASTEASPNELTNLLERLLDSAEADQRMGSVIEILMLQAQLQHLLGNANALAKLEHALRLAEPEGYVRLFVDEGDLMRVLLSEIASRGIKRDYANQLLAIFGTSASSQPLLDALSERELEVLTLIADGLSNREISERLFIALDTVKGHNRLIYQKLQVRRRTEAVARARELGLI